MPSGIAIIAAAAVLAVGIIGGCSILADAIDGLRRLLENMNIVVNHVTKKGGAE